MNDIQQPDLNNKVDLINQLDNIDQLSPNPFKQNKHQRNYSSVSYITNNTNDVTTIKKNLTDLSKSLIVNTNEELLFEELKSKGLIDSDLDRKINEYRTNLSSNCDSYITKELNGEYNNNLSLIIEFNILKGNLESTKTQLDSLRSVLTTKDKKLEILEGVMKRLKEKKEGGKLLNAVSNKYTKDKEEKSVSNNFKRNRKNNSIQIENVAQFLFDKNENRNENNNTILIGNTNYTTDNNIGKSNLTFKNQNNEAEILSQELEKLKIQNEEEIENLNEVVIKNQNLEIKNEKIKFEEKLRELTSDNMLLINSLQDELKFLKEKLNSKKEFNRKNGNNNESIGNSEFEDKKKNLTEKLNYYKEYMHNLLNNTSEDANFNNESIDEFIEVISKNHTYKDSISLKANLNSSLGVSYTNISNLYFGLNLNSNSNTNNNNILTSMNTSKMTNININIDTIQMNYTENHEMRRYPDISKQRISFETNPNSKRKVASERQLFIINPEEYLSNSTSIDIQTVKVFNPKSKQNI